LAYHLAYTFSALAPLVGCEKWLLGLIKAALVIYELKVEDGYQMGVFLLQDWYL